MRFLLDTNILSEPLKPRPDAQVMERLREYATDVCTAAPAWNELLFGLYRLPESKKKSRFENYLRGVLEPVLPILPYETRAADRHAAERARLSASGMTPPFVDGQIASIAQTRNLILVTRNVKDFVRFDELIVEDWSKA